MQRLGLNLWAEIRDIRTLTPETGLYEGVVKNIAIMLMSNLSILYYYILFFNVNLNIQTVSTVCNIKINNSSIMRTKHTVTVISVFLKTSYRHYFFIIVNPLVYFAWALSWLRSRRTQEPESPFPQYVAYIRVIIFMTHKFNVGLHTKIRFD